MTTWVCATELRVDVPGIGHVDQRECGVARAVGVLDCPQCGTERAPYRENGEGPTFDLKHVSDIDAEVLARFVARTGERIGVREGGRSGTPVVSDRTRGETNA
jgi:hypothetical protein